MEPTVAKLMPDIRKATGRSWQNTVTPKRPRKARVRPKKLLDTSLPKDGSTPAKPELGEEAQSESDALIKAFRSKGGVIYVVTAYRAEAEIQGGNPILVKRPP